MNIAHDDRLALLKAHNDLKTILQTIWDCQDIWMKEVHVIVRLSDVDKLESLYRDLHRILKFVPKEDEDGYADWVLAEEDDD